MKKRNSLRLVVILLALVVLAGAGYLLLRKRERPTADRYRTEKVDRGDVSSTVTATGTLSAVTTVQVGSQVSGVIARIYVDFNSRVEKGQLLAELDPTPLEAQVEQRRADVVKATVDVRNQELNFLRQKRLAEAGLAAQAELDTAKAGYDAARAQLQQSNAALRQSETNLRYTKILSPVEGVVVDRQYDVGQTVAASFQAPTLFTIAQDLTKMQVQADVDQSDIGQVKVGQPVRFTVDAYPEEEFQGRISQMRLNAQVNQNVVSYPVIIEVPNPEGRLRPQMTANVTIEVAKVKDVLRIPNAALRFRPETDGPENPSAGGPGGGGFERNASRMGERAGGMAGASRAFDATKRRKKPGQTVYAQKGTELEPVQIRTGISDGRYTQVVAGELKEGMVIVVGPATSKVPERRGPRMGRF